MTTGDNPSGPPVRMVRTEPLAEWSLALGIFSLLLIWPAGIMFGPTAVVLAVMSLGRIKRSGGLLAGSRMAVVGLVIGGIVAGLYGLIIDLEILSVVLTGSLAPAAP